MFFDAAQTIRAKVRYYFALPTAKPLPFPSRFVSQHWDTVHWKTVGPGEDVSVNTSYDKGKPPAKLTGDHWCGPVDWWRNGAPSNAPPLVRNIFGVAECCEPEAGIVLGGRAEFGLTFNAKGGIKLGGNGVPGQHFSGGILLGGAAAYGMRMKGRPHQGIMIGGDGQPVIGHIGGILLGGAAGYGMRMKGRPHQGIKAGGHAEPFLSMTPPAVGGVELGGTDIGLGESFAGEGGIKIGGSGNPSTAVTCLVCNPGTTRGTWTVTCIGFVGPGAIFNGTHILLQVLGSPCLWQKTLLGLGNFLTFTCAPGTPFAGTFYQGFLVAAFYNNPLNTPDCSVPQTVNRTFTTIGGPLSLTYTPA